MHSRPHIALIGTGAMACFSASRLNGYAKLTLVGSWRHQIDTIKQHGLTLIELDGSKTKSFPAATADIDEVQPADFALILTKSYQTLKLCNAPNDVLLMMALL